MAGCSRARQNAASLFRSSRLSGVPGRVDRAVSSALIGSAKSCVSASNVIFRPIFVVRRVLVNRSRAPVVLLASSLQLALNLLDFCYIVRREHDLAGEDYK